MRGDDRIELRGVEVLLFCGVLPEEKVRRQPFRFDISIELDLGRSATTDNIDDTVNYAAVIDQLAELQNERFDLLERVAGRALEMILSDPKVEAAEISVHKMRPPVPHQVESTGVTMRRQRT